MRAGLSERSLKEGRIRVDIKEGRNRLRGRE